MSIRKQAFLGGVVILLAVACSDGEPLVEEDTLPGSTMTPLTTTTVVTTTPPPSTTTSTLRATMPPPSTSTSIAPATTTTRMVTTTTSSLPSGWSIAEVTRVVDGDTIDISLREGSTETVRLIGTNSPEGGECYAAEATTGLAGLVDGQPVLLEPDTTDRDQFGRLLRYVWTVDDVLVNEVTVEEGWALAREYPPDTARAAQLESAQERASSSSAGLWAPDACGAPSHSDVQIVHVEYDAEGNDNFNLNGEWVEITNADDVPVDLTGWVLKDESATHRYSFPSGFVLRPGATTDIYTGCGTDSAVSLYWCVTGSAVWNNSGDTAFLLDPDGNIVYSLSYG